MLPAIQSFITAHWEILSFVLAYCFVAFVNSIPAPGDPRPLSEKMYDTVYTFLHVIANKAVERRPNLATAPVQIGGTSQNINIQPPKETK